MLSRIAESLFWIGRYIERSDGTARILDVHLQLCSRTRGSTRTSPAARCSRCHGPMPLEDMTSVAPTSATLLAVDRQRQLDRLLARRRPRERPPRPRDRLDRAVGVPQHHAHPLPRTASPRQSHEFFGWVRERSALADRHRRLGDQPRRGLAVLRPRPRDRARRHDRPAARHRRAAARPRRPRRRSASRRAAPCRPSRCRRRAAASPAEGRACGPPGRTWRTGRPRAWSPASGRPRRCRSSTGRGHPVERVGDVVVVVDRLRVTAHGVAEALQYPAHLGSASCGGGAGGRSCANPSPREDPTTGRATAGLNRTPPAAPPTPW